MFPPAAAFPVAPPVIAAQVGQTPLGALAAQTVARDAVQVTPVQAGAPFDASAMVLLVSGMKPPVVVPIDGSEMEVLVPPLKVNEHPTSGATSSSTFTAIVLLAAPAAKNNTVALYVPAVRLPRIGVKVAVCPLTVTVSQLGCVLATVIGSVAPLLVNETVCETGVTTPLPWTAVNLRLVGFGVIVGGISVSTTPRWSGLLAAFGEVMKISPSYVPGIGLAPKAVISTLTVIGVPALVVVPEVGATCNQAGAEENVRLNGSVPPWRLPLATRLNVIGAACVPITVAGKTTEFALSPLIRALKVGLVNTVSVTGMLITVLVPVVATATLPLYTHGVAAVGVQVVGTV